VGVTEEQIAAIEQGIGDSPALSELERAVLKFASEVVAGPAVSDETFASVSQRLSPREIVELLLTVGNYLMLARVMTTLELEIDAAAGDAVLNAQRTR
jgi:4-carboxymuconolactone decarboxylase